MHRLALRPRLPNNHHADRMGGGKRVVETSVSEHRGGFHFKYVSPSRYAGGGGVSIGTP
jgi:hypothetical protein